jgi:hypothetical protein
MELKAMPSPSPIKPYQSESKTNGGNSNLKGEIKDTLN